MREWALSAQTSPRGAWVRRARSLGTLLVCAGRQGSPVRLWGKGPAETAPVSGWAISGKTKALPDEEISKEKQVGKQAAGTFGSAVRVPSLQLPKPRLTLAARETSQRRTQLML